MSRINILSVFFCLLQFFINAKSEGYYSILASRSIYPNSKYDVAVSIHKSTEPSTVKLDIVGPTFTESKTVLVQPFSSELIKFDIPNISQGEYNFTAEGISGLKFKNSTYLEFVNNKYCVVLIQTDKGQYKPGDLVRYRVLVLNRDMKPYENPNSVNILINDPNQNRIQQLNDVNLVTGVFKGELQLSTYPPLGKWKIQVNVEDAIEEKTFDIIEYVLPKFEVTVDSPKNFAIKNEKIHATIRAKYTYGKPVKGEAVVTVINNNYHYYDNIQKGELMSKTIPIDGKGHVEFDIKNELQITRIDWVRQYTIRAVVEEKLTGIKQNSTGNIRIHPTIGRIETVDFNSIYETDVPFKVTLKVVDHDDKPIIDTANPILIRLVDRNDCLELARFTKNFDSKGLATVEFTIPPTDDYSVNYAIQATYSDIKSFVANIRKKEEVKQIEDRFTINVQTENVNINNEVSVEVKANQSMKYFVYQIYGRDAILESKLVEVPSRNYHTFKFKPTFEMFPSVNLFVYFIQSGKLVYQKKQISFEEKFNNFLKIDLPVQAKPSQEIDVKVSSNPNSYVGLLGVDQSVLLLNKGNDLNKDDIYRKLRDFTYRQTYYRPREHQYEFQPFSRNVLTFTNAIDYLHRDRPDYEYSYGYAPQMSASSYSAESLNRGGLGGVPGIAGVPGVKGVTVRKEFPETWLWTDVNVTDGSTIIKAKVPDTITSWVVSGFSIDNVNGIGLTKAPRKLQVFQPFFVTTNLPYSVKRGEVIAIPVVVFNYMDQDLEAELTLDNEDQEFEFVDLDNDISDNEKPEIKRSKQASVLSNSGQTVSFMIRPKKVGNIKIKVTGITPLAGDAFERSLLVEPEGVTEYVNKAFLVDLRKQSENKKDVAIEVPDNAVPDSTHIEVSVVGDILGPTIKNLDKLVRMPYGCGEQNMVNFVPNILVLKYLGHIGQLTPDIESKAKRFLEIGYQRELTYRHVDGSFSTFGERENYKRHGSTWLTAYVARSFRQAAEYTHIDELIIKTALSYLARATQNEDGSFKNQPSSFNYGDSKDGAALTAFTVLAFLENEKEYPEYKEVISKALNFLAKTTESSNDLYTNAITSYVLQRAKHDSKDSLLNKLDTSATIDDDRKFWKKIEKTDDRYWYYHPRSVNVEMTAYALLAFLEADRTEDSLPILKWLISQRNSNGGFSSTQDTVVGLHALTKFAEKYSAKENKIEVGIKGDEGVEGKLTVNPDNAIVLQSYEVPSNSKKISLTSTGQGVSLVQVSYRYNINYTETKPSFVITQKVDGTNSRVKISACTNYIPIEGSEKSNMALMEINLPSGFTVDTDSITTLKGTDGVKRVETKKGDTIVVIYFDSLDKNQICVSVNADRLHKVALQKPVPIIVYDYYDNSRQARVFYEAPESSLCDICEDDDCSLKCSK